MPNEKPWYQRSEFWISVITTLLGILAQKSGNATVQEIGAAFAGISGTSYIVGRSQVKKAAVGKAIP